MITPRGHADVSIFISYSSRDAETAKAAAEAGDRIAQLRVIMQVHIVE
jgi:hypothetical protein